MNAATIIEALLAPPGRANPYPLYANAHQFGAAVAITDDLFLVSGYDAVNQVLRNPGFGMADPDDSATHDSLTALNRSILRTNPPEHRRMRSLISSVFTPRRVADLSPVIEKSVDLLLDGLQLPVSVICELLGVPQADRHRFRTLAADLTILLELTPDADSLGPASTAAQELADYFSDLITDRRDKPRDDLISALVAARDAEDGRLSGVELVANLVVLLVAGFETTTNLLGNGLAILFQYPELMAPLRSGRMPVPGFVEEVLRYDPPVQATVRVARTAGLNAGGLAIPTGSALILLIGAANRDPAHYADPDRFDPTRTGNAPLSFGAGAHICLGNNLARLEAHIAFPRLLTRFPRLVPAAPPTRRDRLILRGYETLPIATTERRCGDPA